MFWFIVISITVGIVALIFLTRTLVQKSQRSTNNQGLNSLNDSAKTVKSELFKLQFTDHAEKFGEKTYQQFEELEKKYIAYLQTLNQKFNPHEVTYDRYLLPVQQVQQSLSENFKKLRDITLFLGNNSEDVKNLQKKSTDLLNDAEKSKLEMQKKYISYFDEIHSLNQKALNELDGLTLSLAKVNSSQEQDPKQIEYLVKELGVLAERAKKYNLN